LWAAIVVRASNFCAEKFVANRRVTNKSLEEQIEERIRRDQAILRGNNEEAGEDERENDEERSGCQFPLAVLLALALTLYKAATALANLL
jgi:hypothetical protein